MTIRGRLYAFVALGALTTLANADTRFVEPRSELRSVQDRAHLHIAGQITDLDAKAVEQLITVATKASGFVTHAGAKRPVVFLDSAGGEVLAAIRIGRILRQHAAWVWVDKGAECSSACAFILAGGVERNIATGARVRLKKQ